ncbi:proprotein convertase subtilisin/kexin type 4 isoform X12 [Mycteria americana]|uniref:proprotein convertase subtilisin/kexin type 4 isoform X12 n=1 Tax=Mycteria americana TaxID=33587 RepID=UPI003F581386
MIFYPAEATAWLTWLCCPEARQDGLQTAARGSLLAPETQHRPCWVQTQIGNCSRAREGGKLGIFSLAAASPFQTGTENRGPLLFGGSGASALPLPPKVHRTRARPQPRDRFARKTPDRVQTQPAHSGTCPFTDPFPPRSGKTSPAAGKGPGTRAQWATGKPQAPLGRFYIKYRIGARGQVMEGEPYYHFKHRGTRQKALSRHWGWNMRLTKEPKVLWFEQQTVKKRTKRSVSVVPTDPWFHKQWYMNNDIDPDLNILTAWSKGYTGLGVVLTVLDDGIEKDHPDLSANYDPLASYDFNSNDPDPQPRYTTRDENRHGTRCAGEVAAAANNRICGAGVAYNARVGGVRMLDGPITDVVEAQSLSLRPQHIHIYSASWGPEDDGKTVDGPGVLAAEAFYRGVTKGRGGLGSIFIWASGNGGLNYDNCNCDGYANSIYTLSVGSVLAGGQRPWYGEGCSAILTTTYSSRTTSEVQIVTTDLHHRCTDKHTGTSASAPLAAGMIALALEANTDLARPAASRHQDLQACPPAGRRLGRERGRTQGEPPLWLRAPGRWSAGGDGQGMARNSASAEVFGQGSSRPPEHRLQAHRLYGHLLLLGEDQAHPLAGARPGPALSELQPQGGPGDRSDQPDGDHVHAGDRAPIRHQPAGLQGLDLHVHALLGREPQRDLDAPAREQGRCL